MSSISHAQLAIAQLYEQITPETKRQIVRTAVSAIGLGFLTLAVLLALRATFEPVVWAVLLLTGTAWGLAFRYERNAHIVLADLFDIPE